MPLDALTLNKLYLTLVVDHIFFVPTWNIAILKRVVLCYMLVLHLYAVISLSTGFCLIYVCICSTKHHALHRVGVSKYMLRDRISI